ncbi:hypothetical protein ABPG74_019822 [Tetrahymena malaccensis]
MEDKIKAAIKITIPIQTIPTGPIIEQNTNNKIPSSNIPFRVINAQHMKIQTYSNIQFSCITANRPNKIKQKKILIGNPNDLAAQKEILSLIILITRNRM